MELEVDLVKEGFRAIVFLAFCACFFTTIFLIAKPELRSGELTASSALLLLLSSVLLDLDISHGVGSRLLLVGGCSLSPLPAVTPPWNSDSVHEISHILGLDSANDVLVRAQVFDTIKEISSNARFFAPMSSDHCGIQDQVRMTSHRGITATLYE